MMMFRCGLFMVGLMLVSSATCARPTAAADDVYPAEQRTGYRPDVELPESPGEVWRYEQTPHFLEEQRNGITQVRVFYDGLSDGLVIGERLYFADGSELKAVRAADGQPIWSYRHGARIETDPVSDGHRIFIASEQGITALEVDAGQRIWKSVLEGGAGSVIVSRSAGVVLVGGFDGALRALDSGTGRLRWQHSVMIDVPPDPPGFRGEQARFGMIAARPSAASCDDETWFQSIFDQSRVVAIDIQSGKRRWSYATGGWVYGAPVATEDRVLIVSQDKHLHCVDKQSGELIWKFPTRSRVESGAAVHAGRAYFGSCDGSFYCIDVATGEQLWKYDTEPDYTGRRFIYSHPLLTDNGVYFAAGEGQLIALNPADGSLRWKLRPAGESQLYCSPITDGRHIFVVSRPNWDEAGVSALLAIGQP